MEPQLILREAAPCKDSGYKQRYRPLSFQPRFEEVKHQPLNNYGFPEPGIQVFVSSVRVPSWSSLTVLFQRRSRPALVRLLPRTTSSRMRRGKTYVTMLRTLISLSLALVYVFVRSFLSVA